jgi:hypothetical protein
MTKTFETAYPNLSRWIEAFGWIEMGQDDYSRSLIRILDTGGMIWESQEHYDSLDDALSDAEAAMAAWFKRENIVWPTQEDDQTN